ncbi:MAG: putative tellurite resistance protein B-like protein [Maribacter sp.]|jgi:uncharacterized tellurite resistance protein B-like protein
MSIADLYDSGEHQSNIAHFAAIVNLAAVDKAINSEEEIVLKRLAFKLHISEEKYKKILKNPDASGLMPPYDLETRLERIKDLFRIIYADNEIDTAEKHLILRYAIGLGFSEEKAREEIQKCIRVFGSRIRE